MTNEILPERYDQPLSALAVTSGNKQAIDWCQSWLHDSDPTRGLVLVGDPGTGKTAIGCALVHDAAATGIDVDFITAPNLRTAITRQMDLMTIIEKLDVVDDATSELIEWRTRSERFWLLEHQTDLLMIDDLGRELSAKSTRFVEDKIDNLLRNRGDAGLATIITTNLNKSQRAQRYGEALMSYLAGVCDWFEVKGGDWRRGEG